MKQTIQRWLTISEPTEWISVLIASLTFIAGLSNYAYRELFLPNTAPVNIDLNIDISPLRTKGRRNNKQLDPVILTVSAANPSPLKVQLYRAYWVLIGLPRSTANWTRLTGDQQAEISLDPNTADQFNSLQINADTQDNPLVQNPASLKSIDEDKGASGKAELIAIGPLFPNNEMEARQSVNARRVVILNRERYKTIEARITIPTTPALKGISTNTNLARLMLLCPSVVMEGCIERAVNRYLGQSIRTPQQVTTAHSRTSNPPQAAYVLQSYWCLRPAPMALTARLGLRDILSLYSLRPFGAGPSSQGRSNPDSTTCPFIPTIANRATAQDWQHHRQSIIAGSINGAQDAIKSGAQVFTETQQTPVEPAENTIPPMQR